MAPTFQTEELHSFNKWYSGVHGYLSLFVCLFGIPMNLINITVLTRPHMRTPINCILTWLAVSDMFTMASYLPFALHFYCIFSPWELSTEKNSKPWMQFMIFHINFSATTHTVTVWLGVTLAIFRYKHIFSPAKGHLTRMRRLVRARLAVLVVTILAVIGLIPNYLTNRLYSIELGPNSTLWVMEDLHLATSTTKPIVLVNLWLYSLLAKLFPCVLMVVYGGLLLNTLRANLRQKLKRMSTSAAAAVVASSTNNKVIHNNNKNNKNKNNNNNNNNNKNSNNGAKTCSDNSRTTRMLLVVIVLFVVTELPQAVLILLSVNLKNFFYEVYVPLGDVMDMLALINNGVNFVLYCSMSRDFRNTVVSLMKTGRDPVKYRGGWLGSGTGCRGSSPAATFSRSTENNVRLAVNGIGAARFTADRSPEKSLVVKLSETNSLETACVKTFDG